MDFQPIVVWFFVILLLCRHYGVAGAEVGVVAAGGGAMICCNSPIFCCSRIMANWLRSCTSSGKTVMTFWPDGVM